MEDIHLDNKSSKHLFLTDQASFIMQQDEAKNKKSLNEIDETVNEQILPKNETCISETVINAIQFYCNIMSRSRSSVKHDISDLISFCDVASMKIKEFGKSPKELKEFFYKFPQLFTVKGNKVLLRNWIIFHVNQQEYLKELLVKFHSITLQIVISAVQFYSNSLYVEAHGAEYPVGQLFRHKSNAPAAIQAVTKNSKEFKDFLLSYPEIFVLRDDNVSLTSSAISYKSMAVWIRYIIGDATDADVVSKKFYKKFSALEVKNCELMKDEISVNEAIEFYFKIIFNHRLAKGISVSKLISKSNGATPLVQSFAENCKNLKGFLSSYPQIFTLSGNIVFLTHLYVNDTNDRYKVDPGFHSKYFHLLEEALLNEKHEQLAVDFFSGMLHKIAETVEEGTEFSINHLYQIKEAPLIVKKIASNAAELKKFLLKFPDVFRVRDDNIVIQKSNRSQKDSKKDESGKTYVKMPASSVDSLCVYNTAKITLEESVKEAINFYSNIIKRFGGTAEINKLLTYNKKSNKVRSIATSFEELKKFLSSYPNHFIIKYDKVILASKYEKPMEKGTYEKNLHKSIHDEDAKNKAILFYSDFIKKQNNKLVPMSRLIGYRSCAPPNVKIVAKNPSELEDFLSQFPEIFTISNGNVMFSKFHQGDTIDLDQECSLESDVINCNDILQDAVEFFTKMLNHFGICRVLSINELFEFKLKSSPKIQKISGSNIQQFVAFLMRYPNYFIVTTDHVIGKKNIPQLAYSGKYENKKFIDPLLVTVFNYFRKYTQNKSLFHIDYLYKNVGRYFLNSDQSPIFKSNSDLLLFLALFPDVFYVDSARIINIISSSRIAFICSGKRLKENLLNRTSESINTKVNKPERLNTEAKNVVKATSDSEINMLTSNMNNNLDPFISINEEEICKTEKSYVLKQHNNIRNLNKRGKNTKKSSNVVSTNESLIYDETFTSDLANIYDEEQDLDMIQDDSLKNNTIFWENNYYTYSNAFHKETFKPLKIEEIEKNVYAQFNGGKLCEDKFCQKLLSHQSTQDMSSSCTGTIFVNRNLKNSNSYNFPHTLLVRQDFNKLTTEALIFLNCILWENGEFRILKLEELFKKFSQAKLEFSIYCRNLEEFQGFLSKFPHDFMVSKNNVISRRNKICKRFYTEGSDEESLPVMIFSFFNLYTKYNNLLHVQLLYSQVGQYFCNVNGTKIFKFPGDMVLFLEMFPEIYYIDNYHVINLTVSRENIQNVNQRVLVPKDVIKNNLTLDNEQYSTMLVFESTGNWKDDVLQNTQLVEDLNQCRIITEIILKSEKVIALDCEGVNLGAAGILTLVQIGLENGKIYIFDIVKDKFMIKAGGLANILESESIVKVIHDSRNDVANLYTEYAVKVNKIFDTRIAHHLIVNSGLTNKHFSKITAIGFNELCTKYGAPINIEKDEMKNVYKCNNMFWIKRPLTRDMLAYAALDVASLVPQLYHSMQKKLKGNSERLVWQLSLNHSISSLNNKGLLFD